MPAKLTLLILIISIAASGQADKYKQQSYDVTPTAEWIKENSASGFQITSIFFQAGKFGVVMSTYAGIDHQLQRTATNETLRDTIQKYFVKGYYISGATGGKGTTWSIVFSKGKELRQEFFIDDGFQTQQIQNTLPSGLKVTSIAGNETKCLTVFSQSTDIEAQEILTNNILPRVDIKDLWDKGYSIMNTLCFKGVWTILMSKTTDIQVQTYQSEFEFPVEWIRKKWHEGYRITSVAKNGEWLVVMSKFH